MQLTLDTVNAKEMATAGEGPRSLDEPTPKQTLEEFTDP